MIFFTFALVLATLLVPNVSQFRTASVSRLSAEIETLSEQPPGIPSDVQRITTLQSKVTQLRQQTQHWLPETAGLIAKAESIIIKSRLNMIHMALDRYRAAHGDTLFAIGDEESWRSKIVPFLGSDIAVSRFYQVQLSDSEETNFVAVLADQSSPSMNISVLEVRTSGIRAAEDRDFTVSEAINAVLEGNSNTPGVNYTLVRGETVAIPRTASAENIRAIFEDAPPPPTRRIIEIRVIIDVYEDDKECGEVVVEIQAGAAIQQVRFGQGEDWNDPSHHEFVREIDLVAGDTDVRVLGKLEERPGEVNIDAGLRFDIELRTDRNEILRYAGQKYFRTGNGDTAVELQRSR